MEEKDWLDVSNYKPEEVLDDRDFKPISGAYECRIDRFERVKGTQDSGETYDFYSLSLQVVKTLEGDKGNGRFLKKTYRGDNDGIKKMLNDMFTAKIDLDRSSQEALDISLASVKDKIVKVRARAWKPERTFDGEIIPEGERITKQTVKIVKEFKLGKKGEENESLKSSEVPF